MAFDTDLAARVRAVLGGRTDVEEKKMFGGITFMVSGHMCCGVLKDELIVRMAPETAAQAIDDPDARLFDFTGKPMKGMVAVSNACGMDDTALGAWVRYGTNFVAALPPR